ncbi:MAG: SIMPL domain-containing protein [Patescibacteria group bacterium]|nr:SIMPL domain-containing protein [Patescibacteria group bacterium]
MNAKHIPPVLLSPVIFFALLALYTRLIGPLPLSVSSVVTQKTDTFSVTGEGKAIVVPDIAVVTVGVQTQESTAKQAQSNLNTKINAVSEAVKRLGIDEKDIQTTNYSIYPIYDWKQNTQKITGYQASTTLVIKVRDLDKANTVLDTATEQGANTIGGITFDVSDRSKAEDEARQKAFQEAHKKAQRAAQIAGFRLGKVINYAENTNQPIYPLPFARMQAAPEMQDAKTNVKPGSQEVVITVTISYEIQ